jgi:membrane fusion protein, heavy metal efflux system
VKTVLVLSLFLSFAGAARAADIALDAAQIERLGIRQEAPVESTTAAAAPWSARVVASADAEWVVTAPAGGVVVRLPVTEGQRVAANAVVAELRSADVPELGAMLAQARAQAALARSNSERDRTLHAEGLIAERRMRESDSAATQADAALGALQSRMRLMGVSAADASAGRVTVRATAAATVLERMVGPGQRVGEADALLRLADASQLMLELNLPLVQAQDVREGDVLMVEGSGQPARVSQIGWGASDATQTVRILARLDAAGATLRPGQWVKARRNQPAGHAWRVPSSAISHNAGKTWVFARTAAGYRAVDVQVLSQSAGQATVSGALDAKDGVVVAGVAALKAVWLGNGAE